MEWVLTEQSNQSLVRCIVDEYRKDNATGKVPPIPLSPVWLESSHRREPASSRSTALAVPWSGSKRLALPRSSRTEWSVARHRQSETLPSGNSRQSRCPLASRLPSPPGREIHSGTLNESAPHTRSSRCPISRTVPTTEKQPTAHLCENRTACSLCKMPASASARSVLFLEANWLIRRTKRPRSSAPTAPANPP